MKNIGFKIIYVITALVIIVELAFAVKASIFTDISDLPKGTLQHSYLSPNEEKTMNIYLVKNNLGVAIRGEIVAEDEAHNIFWQTGIDSVEAIWMNDNTVVINDIPLAADDKFGYDCRRGYSLFDEGALEQNFTDFENQHEEK